MFWHRNTKCHTFFIQSLPFEKTELNLTSGWKCSFTGTSHFSHRAEKWIKRRVRNHKWAEQTNRAGWLVAGGRWLEGWDREDRGLGPSRQPDQCLPHKLELLRRLHQRSLFWGFWGKGTMYLTLQLWTYLNKTNLGPSRQPEPATQTGLSSLHVYIVDLWDKMKEDQ